ncbi:MAG: alpha-glucosidase [Spirochaetales bacterium]|nr:alpha-glucosidase [Spirochaetales bacterium]
MTGAWWKEGVVYQIYPRSFLDSNGDGIGDLKGIIKKLDYIRDLGVDILWLNPVYASPNDDNGYDISDYQDIMNELGTMKDWENLLAGIHARDMRLIMDLVVNHTSDEHPWFLESRSSKDNMYRDYYIWRPGDGREPNNWVSYFSGSVWEYEEITGEYYLHLFTKKQPDLNWENPRVREDIYDMMRWWLNKGIDGFRMDVITMISKAPGLPSVEPVIPGVYVDGSRYYANGPRIHDYLKEMKRKALAGRDVMTVGEAPNVSPETALSYVGGEDPEMDMLFQFELMDLDRGPGGRFDSIPWKLTDMKRIIEKWQTTLHGKGWNSNYLMNHDQSRAVSRFGNDREYRVESAKLLATLTMTLEGTPYVYQGEEIGMTNAAFETIEDYRDVEILNHYREHIRQGKNEDDLLSGYRARGRDNSRTPMQWDSSPNGGFTSANPWIKVNPNYPEINVAADLASDYSIIRFYRNLIKLRKSSESLIYGRFQLLDRDNPHTFCYLREGRGGDYFIALNFSDTPREIEVDGKVEFSGECLLSNYTGPYSTTVDDPLRPWEARVYQGRRK